MPGFRTEWTVYRHGPVQKIDEGILTVEGEIRMPLGRFPRRMTVVRLSSGGTIIFSAVALNEPAMQEIEKLGPPSFLVVPNGFHRTDARVFKQRYPGMKVICPAGARGRVEQAVAVDATTDIFSDTAVRFITVPGTGESEAAVIVRRGGRTTLILNDIVSNVRHPKGLGANIMARLFGFGVKRPQMAREVKWLFVKDKSALAAQLREWADITGIERIIPSHGEIIDSPAPVLRRIATELG